MLEKTIGLVLARGGDGKVIREGEPWESEAFEESEISFDGVRVGGGDGDAFIESKPCMFVVALAGPIARLATASGEGDPDGALEQSLKVDDQIIVCVPEFPNEREHGRGKRPPADPPREGFPGTALPHDDPIQGGMAVEEVLGGFLDEPGDLGVGPGTPEGCQGRESMGDVPQGAELDDENVQGADGGEDSKWRRNAGCRLDRRRRM